MPTALTRRPLLTWQGFQIRVDLDLVELFVARQASGGNSPIRRLHLGGAGETVLVEAELALKGLPARMVVELTEVRLYRGFLGCRVAGVRGPMGVPVPLSLVAWAVSRFAPRSLRLDADDRVLLYDLRGHLPPELELSLRRVQVEGRFLLLIVGSGAMSLPPAPP